MIIPPQNMMLRPIEENDHKWLVELHNDSEVLANLTHPEPITLAQHLVWWESVRTNPKQLRMIFTVNGESVGVVKFYDIDRTNMNCVLGADIHKDHRGKGYAKYMWAMMLNVSFLAMSLHRVGLTTAEFNYVAQRVYTNLGFKQEGRLTASLFRNEKFYDQICMYMLAENWLHNSEGE